MVSILYSFCVSFLGDTVGFASDAGDDCGNTIVSFGSFHALVLLHYLMFALRYIIMYWAREKGGRTD